jgi:hypothetical protein
MGNPRGRADKPRRNCGRTVIFHRRRGKYPVHVHARMAALIVIEGARNNDAVRTERNRGDSSEYRPPTSGAFI